MILWCLCSTGWSSLLLRWSQMSVFFFSLCETLHVFVEKSSLLWKWNLPESTLVLSLEFKSNNKYLFYLFLIFFKTCFANEMKADKMVLKFFNSSSFPDLLIFYPEKPIRTQCKCAFISMLYESEREYVPIYKKHVGFLRTKRLFYGCHLYRPYIQSNTCCD